MSIKREEYHSYSANDKVSKVFLTNEGWEVDFYNKGYFIKTEKHYDKSEAWAEDVADNYVLGIKLLTE